MKQRATHFLLTASVLALCANHGALADSTMDSTNTYMDHLDPSAAIHVHPFSTEGADLGKPKFKDTAQAMAKSAPHLLAADVVTALRNAGFSAVTLDESEGEPAAGAMNLTGRFTKLDPGSQNLRLWVGLGAGESKVCISGQLADATGKKLADFADCRNGLGWGASGPQGDKGAMILGDRVAKFLADLAR